MRGERRGASGWAQLESLLGSLFFPLSPQLLPAFRGAGAGQVSEPWKLTAGRQLNESFAGREMGLLAKSDPRNRLQFCNPLKSWRPKAGNTPSVCTRQGQWRTGLRSPGLSLSEDLLTLLWLLLLLLLSALMKIPDAHTLASGLTYILLCRRRRLFAAHIAQRARLDSTRLLAWLPLPLLLHAPRSASGSISAAWLCECECLVKGMAHQSRQRSGPHSQAGRYTNVEAFGCLFLVLSHSAIVWILENR